MKKQTPLEYYLGLFFVGALVVGAIILHLLGGIDLLRHGLRVNARFADVLELKPGDPVKMAGKQIGRVDAIELADGRLLVRMRILDPKAVVRTDTQATIKFSGLLGQNFVSLDFGSAKGQPITIPDQEIETVPQPDVSSLLAHIDGVAKDLEKISGNFTDLKLDEVVFSINDFIKVSRPHILGIVSNVHLATDRINSGAGTVGRLIHDDSPTNLYNSALTTITNINTTANDVQRFLTQAQAAIDDVRAGRGTLGQLVTNQLLYAELTEAATNLKEVLQKVNRGQGAVGKLVNDDALINDAKLTLQKLDKATESLEDQGPLTVIGILANPLF
jgi:phospholipid/cholesterol/gamma-HCH transport system substrate-binding protein